MAKITENELRRLKHQQNEDDDDLSLDIKKRYKTKKDEEKKSKDDSKTGSDAKKLFIVIGSVVIVFLLIFGIMLYYKIEEEPAKKELTIDDLHAKNLKNELNSEEGYVYNGHSFVRYNDVWYSQVQKNKNLYDITFNNDPKSVENILIEGNLEPAFNQQNIFITFDTNASSASRKYIAVANAGLSLSLVKGFAYNLTATCTTNETACLKNGIVTCKDSDKAVIYFKEDNSTKIMLSGNCATIQGYGPDIVRAKDRLLMRWYGIMD